MNVYTAHILTLQTRFGSSTKIGSSRYRAAIYCRGAARWWKLVLKISTNKLTLQRERKKKESFWEIYGIITLAMQMVLVDLEVLPAVF